MDELWSQKPAVGFSWADEVEREKEEKDKEEKEKEKEKEKEREKEKKMEEERQREKEKEERSRQMQVEPPFKRVSRDRDSPMTEHIRKWLETEHFLNDTLSYSVERKEGGLCGSFAVADLLPNWTELQVTEKLRKIMKGCGLANTNYWSEDDLDLIFGNVPHVIVSRPDPNGPCFVKITGIKERIKDDVPIIYVSGEGEGAHYYTSKMSYGPRGFATGDLKIRRRFCGSENNLIISQPSSESLKQALRSLLNRMCDRWLEKGELPNEVKNSIKSFDLRSYSDLSAGMKAINEIKTLYEVIKYPTLEVIELEEGLTTEEMEVDASVTTPQTSPKSWRKKVRKPDEVAILDKAMKDAAKERKSMSELGVADWKELEGAIRDGHRPVVVGEPIVIKDFLKLKLTEYRKIIAGSIGKSSSAIGYNIAAHMINMKMPFILYIGTAAEKGVKKAERNMKYDCLIHGMPKEAFMCSGNKFRRVKYGKEKGGIIVHNMEFPHEISYLESRIDSTMKVKVRKALEMNVKEFVETDLCKSIKNGSWDSVGSAGQRFEAQIQTDMSNLAIKEIDGKYFASFDIGMDLPEGWYLKKGENIDRKSVV